MKYTHFFTVDKAYNYIIIVIFHSCESDLINTFSLCLVCDVIELPFVISLLLLYSLMRQCFSVSEAVFLSLKQGCRSIA